MSTAEALVGKPAEIRNLAEWQDVPDGAIPACERRLRDVDDVFAVYGKTTSGDDTSRITHVETVDMSCVGWRLAKYKNAAEVSTIRPEATALPYKVIELSCCSWETGMSLGESTAPRRVTVRS